MTAMTRILDLNANVELASNFPVTIKLVKIWMTAKNLVFAVNNV